MKVAICVLAVLASTLASPIEETIDWHNIKPIDLHVEAIIDAPRVPTSRVIGGEVAARNSIPYQAALIINNSGFCGGSLISSGVVLTAAHCVDSATQTQVILGAHNPRSSEATQRNQVTSQHIVHPRWSSLLLQNDVAVVIVSNVALSAEIQVIALAPSTAGSFAGQTARLTGWGRTSDASNTIATELKQVNLQVITNEVCRNTFGIRLQPQHICTSGAGTVGGCNGDSGGPLVINGVEVGVVSFGSTSCEAQLPTAFARVSHFRDWIAEVSGV